MSCDLLARMRRAATSREPLLIRGEAGVGKNLAALVIHRLGAHGAEPLLCVECAALPASMLETELFGAENLVSPGVLYATRGALEAAGAGTLVLNEITVLPLALQQRLAKALQDGRFRRNGGKTLIPLNSRIVALSSTNLEALTRAHQLSAELFLRLSSISMRIPPLRERPLDIWPLAQRLMGSLSQLHRRFLPAISDDATAALEAYSWPGNVRELRQVLELVLLSGAGGMITASDLPVEIRAASAQRETRPQSELSLEEIERKHIVRVLDITRGRKSDAADVLGISRKTLLEKRKRYGLG